MSPLWLIPGLVVMVGSAAVLALVRNAAEEARLLAGELGRQREVGDSIGRLHATMRAVSGPRNPRR